jgi:hypothetical protein
MPEAAPIAQYIELRDFKDKLQSIQSGGQKILQIQPPQP